MKNQARLAPGSPSEKAFGMNTPAVTLEPLVWSSEKIVSTEPILASRQKKLPGCRDGYPSSLLVMMPPAAN